MGAYGRLRPFERLPIAEKNRVDRVLEQVGVSDLAAPCFFFSIRRSKATYSDCARADGGAEDSHPG